MDLPVVAAVLPGSGSEKVQITMQAFLVTNGPGPVHQHGKYILFVGRVVVAVGIKVEDSVRGFMVHLVAQSAIRYMVDVDYKEGKTAISSWLRSELYIH